MGLLKRLRQRRKIEAEAAGPIGLGFEVDPEDAGEIGEGGPSWFRSDIAQLRWAAQNEAHAIAQSNPDPLMWQDGQLAFEMERAIAHAHEGLRDRLANRVGAELRENVRGLYELAGEVASAREDVRVTDDHLVQVTRDYRSLYREIRGDPLELGRYYRLRSSRTQALKKLVAAILIIVELVISGTIFERALALDLPMLGFVLAAGLMAMLVVIPHYVAQGMKEGITRYHYYRWQAEVDAGIRPDQYLQRLVHYEDKDDSGFRVISWVLGSVLVAMILPLSLIRAEGRGFLWFAFFLLLQVAISGYFFLREWLDHGTSSHNLLKLVEKKESVESRRSSDLENLAAALAEFYDEAEELVFFLREAPRWDSYLVHTCYETIHYMRHLIAVERPELGPFVTYARMPYLGSTVGKEASPYPLDPTSNEHLVLEEPTALGREWWLRQASGALAALPHSLVLSEDEMHADDVSWLVTKSPALILREFMRRYFGLEDQYRRPAELDPEPPEEQGKIEGDPLLVTDAEREVADLERAHAIPAVEPPGDIDPPAGSDRRGRATTAPTTGTRADEVLAGDDLVVIDSGGSAGDPAGDPDGGPAPAAGPTRKRTSTRARKPAAKASSRRGGSNGASQTGGD